MTNTEIKFNEKGVFENPSKLSQAIVVPTGAATVCGDIATVEVWKDNKIENIKVNTAGTYPAVVSDGKLADEYALHLNDNVIDAGWIPSEQLYGFFFASDLSFFPGQHSVLWEQACASKVPCVFGKWEGMDHVNNGGNACFLDCQTPEQLRDLIVKLHFTPEYQTMLRAARSEKTDIYLYSRIAEKSLECAVKK
jgi:hypothetical protein